MPESDRMTLRSRLCPRAEVENLEEIDRDRIPHNDAAWFRPDQPLQTPPDLLRQLKPAMLIPRFDEGFTPFPFNRGLDPCRYIARQNPQ